MDRRSFVLAAAVAPVLAGCGEANASTYDDAVHQTWRPTEGKLVDDHALRLELVRYATLAPSSHNTQCWKFRIAAGSIALLPDLSRRCPAVDPDDHHLFVSLGCAAENLVQAALAHGLHGEVRFDPAGEAAVGVALEPTPPRSTPLFDAIPQRQCTRLDFDGVRLGADELRLLEAAGTGQGVRVLMMVDTIATERVLEYVVQGDTRQIDDAAFVTELKKWIRFSDAEALRFRDGLSTRTSGRPSMPRWFASAMLPLFYRASSENDKLAKQVRSSAGIAVFVSERSDPTHWIEVGRCYERFALQAAALGIRNSMLNQAVEVATVRPQFATSLGLRDERPDLVVRFGRGPLAPRSLRRPVAAVLV